MCTSIARPQSNIFQHNQRLSLYIECLFWDYHWPFGSQMRSLKSKWSVHTQYDMCVSHHSLEISPCSLSFALPSIPLISHLAHSNDRLIDWNMEFSTATNTQLFTISSARFGRHSALFFFFCFLFMQIMLRAYNLCCFSIIRDSICISLLGCIFLWQCECL